MELSWEPGQLSGSFNPGLVGVGWVSTVASRFSSLLVALLVAVAGCTTGVDAPPTELPGLTDIETVEELAASYNHDVGSPRLILLLSPI